MGVSTPLIVTKPGPLYPGKEKLGRLPPLGTFTFTLPPLPPLPPTVEKRPSSTPGLSLPSLTKGRSSLSSSSVSGTTNEANY